MSARRVLLVSHATRPDALVLAREVARDLAEAGISVRAAADGVERLTAADGITAEDPAHAAEGCELVVVLGGDGTVLRGAELARPFDVPLLGVNLGHVGFLAEAEVDQVSTVVRKVVDRRWEVEERTTLAVSVTLDDVELASTWALNEASIEKVSRERMLDILVAIDERPLSRWGADGVVVATPTGSTAYAFSAGGPVVWPEVEALLVVPISAHALFARPLVVSPTSTIEVQVEASTSGGVLWCDGRRMVDLAPGTVVEVTRHASPVRFARLHPAPFTDRLVRKFDLPVEGWRGVHRNDHHHHHGAQHGHAPDGHS